MRWSIKNQIVMMFVSIALLTVIAITGINSYVSYRQSQSEVRQQLDRVAETLTDARFPVTNETLKQIKGLTGAEFLLLDPQSRAAASTIEPADDIAREIASREKPQQVSLETPIELGDRSYYLTSVSHVAFQYAGQPGNLYILYPQQTYAREMRRAWLPPVITGLGAALFVGLFGVIASGRFTRKLLRLRDQVNIIAAGQFQPLVVPRRNDEIRDLSIAVNRMSDQLRGYEEQVRLQERRKTFEQIGRAIAHEIRNAVTGGRMAVELHQRQHPSTGENNYLDVALQQMKLMERSVERFLKLGDTAPRNRARFDLSQSVNHAMALVKPMSQHLEVRLERIGPSDPVRVHGSQPDLEQSIINLLTNAIQAASSKFRESTVLPGSDGLRIEPRVQLSLSVENGLATCRICDSGVGPDPAIAETLFEPFCTDKPDGIGLGLSLTHQVIESHQGSIGWNRVQRQTCFHFSIPLEPAEDAPQVASDSPAAPTT